MICALIFFATTINYLDRSVISLLKTYLERDFQWTEKDYSDIVMAFQFCYAVGLLISGRLIDKLGTKIGYAISILLWSISAMGHALVKSTLGFVFARGALGISEAGNFPSAIKTVAEWFPQKERSLATGIFNSGTNIGAVVAPLSVPFIAEQWGWQWAFVITGSVGFIWLIFWLFLYEIPAKQKRLSKTEYDYIQGSPGDRKSNDENAIAEKVNWLQLFAFRQTWAFTLGKFFTDPIWWFYLFWLPAFLKARYNLEGTNIAIPIAIVYTMSTFGSVFGGWLPLHFIKKGWTVYLSRKISMFIYALLALPVLFAQLLGATNMWLAIIIIGIATAAHQAWSANIFTTVSDMFPKKAVASVTGIGGMAGALGGMLIAWAAGLLLDHYKSLGKLETGYYIMFVICGTAYVIAWLVMHLLAPKLQKAAL